MGLPSPESWAHQLNPGSWSQGPTRISHTNSGAHCSNFSSNSPKYLTLSSSSMNIFSPWRRSLVAPWWEPPEVQIAESKEDALKNHDITTFCSPPNTTFIYTDGSGLEDKVGAAAVN